MNRRILHLQLLAVALAITAVIAAACAGTKAGAAPCCAAQGSVQQPGTATSFAPSTTPVLFAQPFVVDSSRCLKYSTLGQPDTVLQSQPAGAAVQIDATLHYKVRISSIAEGKIVQIVVFQKTGAFKVRGIGLIGAPIEPQQADAPIQVAPIRLSDEADPAKVGESALEAATLCELQSNGEMRHLIPADVRAVVTSEIAAAFAVADGPTLIARVLEYDSALEAVESVSDANQIAAFRKMRGDVEATLDAGSATGRAGDLARAGAWATTGGSYGLDPLTQNAFPPPWTVAMTIMAQFLDQKVGTPPSPETALPYHLSLRRQSQMLRLGAAESVLDATIASPLVAIPTQSPGATPTPITINPSATPPGGGPSILDAKAAMQQALLTTDSLPALSSYWFAFGNAVSADFDAQLWPGGSDLLNLHGGVSDLGAGTQSGLDNTTTFQTTLDLFYRHTAAAGPAGYFDTVTGFAGQQPNISAQSTSLQFTLVNLEYHFGVNTSEPVPQETPASP